MGGLSSLLPLVILFAFAGAFAWLGWQMYLYTNELADRGQKHLEKKNIHITREGGSIGVQQKKEEDLADSTQSTLVNAWNLASFPAYKSKLWNTQATPNFKRGSSSGTADRPSASRTASGKSSNT